MTTIESHVESPGNTKTGDSNKPRKAQPTQCYRWQWTLKAHNKAGELIEPETIHDNLKSYCKEWYFQLEKGEDGYIHYQGCLSLVNKERFDTVVNITGFKITHVEAAKNWFALKNYSNKINTRINGPWSHKTIYIKTIQNLNWWQEMVLAELQKQPHPRKIYWIWDEFGNKGKSVFCTYLGIKQDATILTVGGYRDIAQCMPDNPKIIAFDYPRTMDGKVNYTAIEACKDGRIFSAKYESKMKWFNVPHVLVFCNFPPEYHKMSMDRWEVICLDD